MNKSITYFRPGGIGDTVFSVPALKILREHEPEAVIHFIGHLEAGQLLKRAGLIDFAHKQNSQKTPDNIYSGAIEIAGRLGMKFDKQRRESALNSLGNPDLLIAFSIDPLAMSYAFEEMGVKQFTTQYWQPPMGTHQSEFQVLALRNVGYIDKLSKDVIDWKCKIPDVPYLNASKSVILSPGSGLDYKKWPLDRYLELAQKLIDIGNEVLVLEGPMESHLGYKDKFIGSRVLRLNLEEASGLFSLGIPFIGNDSGLTHLAAMSDCPTIALFGPTHPSEWAPIGPEVHVIRNCDEEPSGCVRVCEDIDCMESITVHNVLDIFMREIRWFQ